jgi:hypothetical protein
MGRKLQIAAEKALAHSIKTEPQRWSHEDSLGGDILTRDDNIQIKFRHFTYIKIGGKSFMAIKIRILRDAKCAYMKPIWKAEQEAEDAAFRAISKS